MKPPITRTLVRGKAKWRLNLKKSLTGDERYARRYFDSERAAVKYYNRVLREIRAHGREFAALEEFERAALAKLYKLILSNGLTIEDTAKMIEQRGETAAHSTAVKVELTISQAIDEFYSECEEAELDTDTMREYKSQLERFRRSRGDHLLAVLTKKDIKTWLKKIKVRGRTKNNYITTLRTFCEYCVREETLGKNVAKLVKKPRIYAKAPVILSVEDVVKFANYIRVHEPSLVAPFAIATLAGVRTCELELLLWSDIDFAEREIHIRLEISKRPNQRERWIRMSDNLIAWLSICEDREGKILKYPTMDNFGRRRSAAFEKATGKKWPRNGARKCFGSHDWAIGGDLKETSKNMGNSPQVAKKFYVLEVQKKKGRQFHQVFPERQASATLAEKATTDSPVGGTSENREE